MRTNERILYQSITYQNLFRAESQNFPSFIAKECFILPEQRRPAVYISNKTFVLNASRLNLLTIDWSRYVYSLDETYAFFLESP